jgi:hypothetical protein
VSAVNIKVRNGKADIGRENSNKVAVYYAWTKPKRQRKARRTRPLVEASLCAFAVFLMLVLLIVVRAVA